MARARALVAAVPQRVWTAAAGLALLASLAVAAVIGAGLQVWRGAVGGMAQPPPAAVYPPDSGLVILPGGQAPRVPAPQRPVAASPETPVAPVAFVPRGFTALVVSTGGAEQRVAVPLTAHAEEPGGPETEPDAVFPSFAPHAQASGKYHPRHAHRPHQHPTHPAKHRHGGRHR